MQLNSISNTANCEKRNRSENNKNEFSFVSGQMIDEVGQFYNNFWENNLCLIDPRIKIAFLLFLSIHDFNNRSREREKKKSSTDTLIRWFLNSSFANIESKRNNNEKE